LVGQENNVHNTKMAQIIIQVENVVQWSLVEDLVPQYGDEGSNSHTCNLFN
jgi:hypothetical protein